MGGKLRWCHFSDTPTSERESNWRRRVNYRCYFYELCVHDVVCKGEFLSTALAAGRELVRSIGSMTHACCAHWLFIPIHHSTDHRHPRNSFRSNSFGNSIYSIVETKKVVALARPPTISCTTIHSSSKPLVRPIPPSIGPDQYTTMMDSWFLVWFSHRMTLLYLSCSLPPFFFRRVRM